MWEEIKAWLKKSGIKYSYAQGHLFQGQEMLDDLDPLSEVIPYSDYPLARIYGRNFWMQLVDTYNVLVGDHYDLNLKGHGRKGVLDILIFPVISRRLMAFAFDEKNYFILRIFAGFFGSLFEILRGLLGGVITLILSPIVAMVCVVVFFKEKEEEKKVGNLKIIDTYFVDTDELDGKFVCRDEKASRVDLIMTVPKTLKEFMDEHACTWSDIFTLPGEVQDNKHTKYSANAIPPSAFYIDDTRKNDEATLEAFKALNVGFNLSHKPR